MDRSCLCTGCGSQAHQGCGKTARNQTCNNIIQASGYQYTIKRCKACICWENDCWSNYESKMDLCPHGCRPAHRPMSAAPPPGSAAQPPPGRPAEPSPGVPAGQGQGDQAIGNTASQSVSFQDIMECLHVIMSRLDDLEKRVQALEQGPSTPDSWQVTELGAARRVWFEDAR